MTQLVSIACVVLVAAPMQYEREDDVSGLSQSEAISVSALRALRVGFEYGDYRMQVTSVYLSSPHDDSAVEYLAHLSHLRLRTSAEVPNL